MTIVSHNIELMEEWSTKMGDNSNYYDTLIDGLYSLIYQLEEHFQGGLSDDFVSLMERIRPDFQKYSTTFQESIEYVKERSVQIQDDEQYLKGRIDSGNLFG